jgi:hypothetical protein
MKTTPIDRRAFLGAAALLAAAAAGGCDVSSSSTVARRTLAVAGVYRNPEGGRIVDRNSGAAVTSLSLQQYGDRIEAVDNNGRLFRGTIGGENGSVASFEMKGDTTSGVAVTLTGTIAVDGTASRMQATWIEPSLLGTLVASATVAATEPEPDDGGDTNATDAATGG